MKDYYYILGVTPASSKEEIRKAYLKLSTKFHPDKNNGDKFFEERFKEINEAYEVLSNTEKKFRYDQIRESNKTPPPPPPFTQPRTASPPPRQPNPPKSKNIKDKPDPITYGVIALLIVGVLVSMLPKKKQSIDNSTIYSDSTINSTPTNQSTDKAIQSAPTNSVAEDRDLFPEITNFSIPLEVIPHLRARNFSINEYENYINKAIKEGGETKTYAVARAYKLFDQLLGRTYYSQDIPPGYLNSIKLQDFPVVNRYLIVAVTFFNTILQSNEIVVSSVVDCYGCSKEEAIAIKDKIEVQNMFGTRQFVGYEYRFFATYEEASSYKDKLLSPPQ